MAKNYQHNVTAMARQASRLVRQNMKILRAVSAAAENPEQVKADAKLPFGDAPFYLHFAARMGTAIVKQASEQSQGGGANLNVLIVGQAPTTAAWLDDVRAHEQRAIVEVTPEKVK